jgi:hypothetical protein
MFVEIRRVGVCWCAELKNWVEKPPKSAPALGLRRTFWTTCLKQALPKIDGIAFHTGGSSVSLTANATHSSTSPAGERSRAAMARPLIEIERSSPGHGLQGQSRQESSEPAVRRGDDRDREGPGRLLAAPVHDDRRRDKGCIRWVLRRECETVALVTVAKKVPAVGEDRDAAPIEYRGIHARILSISNRTSRAGGAQDKIL